MTTLCIFPLCTRKVYHDELCINHAKLSTKPKEKKVYVIPRRSKKKRKENAELKPLYEAYLAKEENKVCNIQIDEGCTYIATTVNHLRRRGENVMNQEDWEPACFYCNGKIEEQDKWARENGHLKSKFS